MNRCILILEIMNECLFIIEEYMKKLICLLSILFLTSCANEVEEEYVETIYPVKAQYLVLEERTEFVKYVGILQPEKMVQKTFDNLATVEKIYVEEGDKVKVNQLLAKQDTSDLEATKEEAALNVDSAKSDEEAAYQEMLADKATYDKALDTQAVDLATLKQTRDDAYDQMIADEASLADAQAAYDANPGTTEQAALTSAQQDYNQSVIEYNAADQQYQASVDNGTTTEVEIADANYQASQSRYEAAQTQTSLAQTQYDNINDQITNSYLYSDIDGYVLVLNAEEGETANPLIPVMVLGTSETVVTIGLSQDNVRKVETGMAANVKIGDLNFDGEVLDISRIPDSSSRTYETNIAFPEDLLNFYIGESSVVNIDVGKTQGIWIPIRVIQNDGEDYVFVIKDNRVKKKIIITKHIDNDYVLVEGLQAGDLLITSGMKSVKPGNLVEVISE